MKQAFPIIFMLVVVVVILIVHMTFIEEKFKEQKEINEGFLELFDLNTESHQLQSEVNTEIKNLLTNITEATNE